MLAYILALVVGLGSFGLYMAAFFFPEVHRRNDFIWSGIGLFYALVLWVCAGRITGGILLGQIAGVALLGWLGWQTFSLRRQIAPVDQQTPVLTTEDVRAAFNNLSSPEGRSQLTQQASRVVGQVKDGVQGAIASATQSKSQSPSSSDEVYVPPPLEEFGTAGQEAIERFAKAALPDETAIQTGVEQVQETAVEAAANLAEQEAQWSDPVSSAAHEAAKSVSASQPPAKTPLSDLTEKSTNFVKVLSETVQSLVKGFGKKESKPIYVRKEFRDEPTAASRVTDAKVTDARVTDARVTDARVTDAKVTDATVISVIEEIGRASDGTLVAEAVIEIESEELAPDLLASALSNANAEEIVEELLEDISAQEQTPEDALAPEAETTEAVPPHPPSPDLIEAAIADAEEKGIPYDPPLSEEDHP